MSSTARGPQSWTCILVEKMKPAFWERVRKRQVAPNSFTFVNYSNTINPNCSWCGPGPLVVPDTHVPSLSFRVQEEGMACSHSGSDLGREPQFKPDLSGQDQLVEREGCTQLPTRPDNLKHCFPPLLSGFPTVIFLMCHSHSILNQPFLGLLWTVFPTGPQLLDFHILFALLSFSKNPAKLV